MKLQLLSPETILKFAKLIQPKSRRGNLLCSVHTILLSKSIISIFFEVNSQRQFNLNRILKAFWI